MTRLVRAFLLGLALFAGSLAADEGDSATMQTVSTNCSQLLGTCTITTIYWAWVDGAWIPIFSTQQVIPFQHYQKER